MKYGGNSNTLTATQSGDYWVEYTTNCGTATSIANLIKVFISNIVPVVSGPCGVCPPNCITLHGLAVGGLQPYTYNWTWSGGSASGQTITQCPTTSTAYTLTVHDALGCVKTAVQNVGLCPIFKVNAGANRTIHHGMSTILGGSPTATGGQPPYTYSWSPTIGLSNPNVANPVATPPSTMIYTVTVTDSRGCHGTAQVKVNVF